MNKSRAKTIVLTGGGTAGHVSPNIALLPRLKEDGYDIHYIGSYDGIERGLIEAEGIPYHPISSGKLRRYRSLRNLTDPFRVLHGFFQSLRLLGKLKPNVIFSKGGFVSVPVALASRIRRIPCVIHECDMTPGLANKLAIPFAARICTNFEETVAQIKGGKAVHTGTPIRESLAEGSKETGLALCGFTADKPVIMVTGGSQGAGAINEAVRRALPELTKKFQIAHLCGSGKREDALDGTEGYHQIEYAGPEMKDLYAAADIIISRAGANTLAEILSLAIPNILIPLPLSQSRGDQILNAASFKKKGYSCVLPEEEMNTETLVEAVLATWENRQAYRDAMLAAPDKNGLEAVLNIIREETKES
ncbi:MAG: undecaprenyldiphospho-muramoylpentapeptide beta-N-acetylglucosaminyltransferase [Clostridiales bacterium]|nr:undecaprenyldiphospho-muramoylpentapeptide beta-N-acetylglucosaminyltransferase [Clostridiales bacterium]